MNNADHELIKCELRLRGSSLAQIARKLGVAKSSVTEVSRGRSTSRRIQKAIADELGQSVESLFPDRYKAA